MASAFWARAAACVAVTLLLLCSPARAQAPAFTSAASYSQQVAGTVNFTVMTTGTPDIRIIAGTVPPGVTFIDNGDGTATFGGAPDPGTAGTYNLTLRARSGVGSNARQNFTFTVNKITADAMLNIVPRTAFAGEPIFFQMDLGALAPAPTGSITFTESAEALGTRNVSSGQATIARRRPIGSHRITATYTGDINYEAAVKNRTVKVTAGFRGEVQANTTTGGIQQSPSVVMYRRGYMVVWASQGADGSGYGIVGQRLGFNGVKLDTEFSINTTSAGDQTSPKIAAKLDGGFVVAWQSSAPDVGVYAQQFTGAGIKRGAEFKVNNGGGERTQPAVATLNNDRFVIAWTSDQQDGSGLGVYARRFTESGDPIGREFLVNTRTAGDQSAPAIAGLDDGGFIIVWQSRDPDGLGIFGQRYDATATKVGDEFRINKTVDYDQSMPAVAGLIDGGFVVVWQSDLQDGSGLGIYMQHYREDGTRIRQETRVNTTTADDQSQPAVASFSLGGFVVVWTSDGQDGSGKGVYAQVFNASGTKADVEFPVHVTTAGDQSQPAVGGCVVSEFRVAWVSPDAGGTGVFTQLFFVPVSFGSSSTSMRESTWVRGANCIQP